MTQPSKTRIWGALWIVYVVWGSTYLAIELAIESMPPLLAMGSRFLTAGLIMILALALRNGIAFLKLNLKEAFYLALLGSLLLGLGLGMVALAQHNGVPTGIVALLIAALPLWIAIFKVIDGKGSPSKGWLGIIIGFVGVGLLLQPELSKSENGSHLFWMAMVILGNIGWALGTYIAPRLELPKSSLVTTAYQMLFGGVSMTTVAILAGETWGDLVDATATSWAGWSFLVIIGSIATYSAYLWLVQSAPVGLIATYAYVNPVIAVVLGTVFLNEAISIILLAGAMVVIIGVALVVWSESQVEQRPSPPTS